jgi:hypothetical protein
MSFLLNGLPADPVKLVDIAQNIESYSQADQMYFYHYKMVNAQAYSDDYYFWKNKYFASVKEK